MFLDWFGFEHKLCSDLACYPSDFRFNVHSTHAFLLQNYYTHHHLIQKSNSFPFLSWKLEAYQKHPLPQPIPLRSCPTPPHTSFTSSSLNINETSKASRFDKDEFTLGLPSISCGILGEILSPHNWKPSEYILNCVDAVGCMRNMASLATAEICDTNAAHIPSGDLRVLQPIFQIYGQRRAFSGPIVTLKVFEDNVLVREFLEQKGEGRVLMIDGGGSLRCALVGGNLGQLAQNNGWSGIVVNGCIRDVDEINGCDIGVRALASHPLKSSKKGIGEKHVSVYVGGTLIYDGEWLYADNDGIIVSKFELSI